MAARPCAVLEGKECGLDVECDLYGSRYQLDVRECVGVPTVCAVLVVGSLVFSPSRRRRRTLFVRSTHRRRY